jgi:GMP synthase (glutamine-hydrolysing)
MRPIIVVNNYGQFNHLILRMLRDLGIDARMVSNETDPAEIREGARGIVLGGGPDIARAGRAAEYLGLGLPVLGICLGHHIIAKARGGIVQRGASGGYGSVRVNVIDHDTILAGYPETLQVWASHADEVASVPPGFSVLASSSICGVEAMASDTEPVYGIQWHPEVSHTVDGRLVYENFNRLTLDEYH